LLATPVGTAPDLQSLANALAAGDKGPLAATLARLERAPDVSDILDLLDAAWAAPRAHVIGLTGPPGVGKSTLAGSLIRRWRDSGRTVGVIAVDPSSRLSGGALLGDRTRLRTDPEDSGVYVRSMAARDRLGGLAELTLPAMILMRALFDRVLVETVGVGQSETDVADTTDTVLFCVQPGSGDSLQFMKAGIVEIPDVIAVTKADISVAAERARSDAAGALTLSGNADAGWKVPVLAVSAQTGAGIADLEATIESHLAWLAGDDRLQARRQTQGERWVRTALLDRFGRVGMRQLGKIDYHRMQSPFRTAAELAARLSR